MDSYYEEVSEAYARGEILSEWELDVLREGNRS